MTCWFWLLVCFLFFPVASTCLPLHSHKSRPGAGIHRKSGLYNPASIGGHPEELRKRDGSKYVFIHHMVGNTFPYTQADWEDDIRRIQAKGVDGIALNIGSSDWQRGQVANAYAAASAVGTKLKLFISFDFTEMPCSIPDVVSRVNQWANHPYQFKVNGKTMISTFSGDCFRDSGWQSIRSQTNGYLMPFIWGLEGQFAHWPSLDSWMCWGCAWPQGDYAKNINDDVYYLSQLGTHYAATISPWFYTHYSFKNYILRSDDWLLVTRWEQLISLRDKLTFVEMISWNDYGESHYLGPLKGTMPSGTSWVEGLPHSAWFDLSEYYIKAFQTGSYPAITKDVIYFWARPHPVSTAASSDPFGKPAGWDWVEDSLWAVVFATSSGSVSLKSGSNEQTFSVSAGVSKLKLALAPGSISVSMTRNGQVIINYTPSDFTFVTHPTTYNYNAYVGSASSIPSPVVPPSGSNSSTSASPFSTALPSHPTLASSPASSSSTPSVGFTYVGCYVDPADARVLNGGMTTSSSQTVASCVSTCAAKGFSYAGTEYGSECWCGSAIRSEASLVSSSNCSMPCSGRSSDSCGAGYRVSIYRISGLAASSGLTISSMPSPSVIASSTATSRPPNVSSTPSYLGCYVDPSDARILNGGSTSSLSQTINDCLSSCTSRGFAFAGTEYGVECWCGSAVPAGASSAGEGDCSMPCSGKSTDQCGGPNRMSLYTLTTSSSTAIASSSAFSPSLTSVAPASGSPSPTRASYLGCYVDSSNPRILNGNVTRSSSQSVSNCLTSCTARGFLFGGTEYGDECWCGSFVAASATRTTEADCSMPCGGKSSDKCGGSYRMSLYSLTSPSPSPPSAPPVSSSPSATHSVAWTYVGCVAEGTTGSRRALTDLSFTKSDMTPQQCQPLCSDYDYAGVEYGTQCYCGNSLINNGATGTVIGESSCSSTCSGNSSEKCGGSWTLSLYTRRAIIQSLRTTVSAIYARKAALATPSHLLAVV